MTNAPSISTAPAAPASSYYAPAPALAKARAPQQFWLFLVAGAILFYFFFAIDISNLGHRWYTDVGWSHGFLVPIFSIFLIYLSWQRLLRLPIRPSYAVGLPVLLFGCASHVVFLAFGQYNCAELSIVITLLGLTLFILGVDHLRLLWVPIVYLVFSIPPPEAIFVKMTFPLQELAASSAVNLLPLFGIGAQRTGVEILIPTGYTFTPLDVAEACSGMRMLVAFFALAVILGYSTSRPMWQKLILGLGALPIAIMCNIFRVILIAVLYVYASPEYARGSTHLWVGMLMLVPALFMQLGLAWVLDKIFVEDAPDHRAPPAAPGGLIQQVPA